MEKLIYKIEKEYFTLEPNDLLIIPKNKLHKAIGLTPRIILSYGIY
jgi:mannose-6-phosphate isomerase-like protein (cupin superfamily)